MTLQVSKEIVSMMRAWRVSYSAVPHPSCIHTQDLQRLVTQAPPGHLFLSLAAYIKRRVNAIIIDNIHLQLFSHSNITEAKEKWGRYFLCLSVVLLSARNEKETATYRNISETLHNGDKITNASGIYREQIIAHLHRTNLRTARRSDWHLISHLVVSP